MDLKAIGKIINLFGKGLNDKERTIQGCRLAKYDVKEIGNGLVINDRTFLTFNKNNELKYVFSNYKEDSRKNAKQVITGYQDYDGNYLLAEDYFR